AALEYAEFSSTITSLFFGLSSDVPRPLLALRSYYSQSPYGEEWLANEIPELALVSLLRARDLTAESGLAGESDGLRDRFVDVVAILAAVVGLPALLNCIEQTAGLAPLFGEDPEGLPVQVLVQVEEALAGAASQLERWGREVILARLDDPTVMP